MVVNRIQRRTRRALMLVALLPFLMLTLLTYNGEALADHKEIEAQLPDETDTQTVTVEEFAEAVIRHIDNFWDEEFRERGYPYASPTLKFVDNRPEETRCEENDGSTKYARPKEPPFYCRTDETVYFPRYAEIQEPDDPNGPMRRLEEFGDFNIGVVIAHEMGHHAQEEMRDYNIENPLAADDSLTIQRELQADCFAAVWARSVFFNGEVPERAVLREAAVIMYFLGDPDKTHPLEEGAHGQFEQRFLAFVSGYRGGDSGRCF
jgi:uncharacterized protein